jgi:proteic killer suppression protein
LDAQGWKAFSAHRLTSVRAKADTTSLDPHNATRYYPSVIKSFRDKESRRLFERERISQWSTEIQRAALRKLLILDAAEEIADLRLPPGNRLEKLSGDRAGSYSIRINDQWRVCFEWRDGDAYEVEVTDYH